MPDSAKMLSDEALDTLFRSARTYNGWTKDPVGDDLLEAVYDLCKMGPTSANCCPARFIFVRSPEAKEKLKPCLASGNVDKTMAAPVTAIIINDYKFFDKMDKLAPHRPNGRAMFAGDRPGIDDTAFRNATLQGAYLMLAARALGLDCGPMSGFDKKKIKQAFFADQEDWEANWICNLGYGDPASVYPRAPRLEFSDVCKVV